jgi:hypothetical protein
LSSPDPEDDISVDGSGCRAILAIIVAGEDDLYESVRASTSDPWPTPVPVDALNTNAVEGSPQLSPDGLRVVFVSDRFGSSDLFIAHRTDLSASFVVSPIDELNTSDTESDPWLSGDGRILYFSADPTGVRQIYVSVR